MPTDVSGNCRPMQRLTDLLARLRLRHLLFAIFAVLGAVPIVFITIANVGINRTLLEDQEMLNLSRHAELISKEVGWQVDRVSQQLRQPTSLEISSA